MTTAKIINNTIYFLVLTTVIILDKKNFQPYFGIVFAVIQIISIYAEYAIANRTIPGEALLVKKTLPVQLKNLLLYIPFIILYLAGLNFLFKLLTTMNLVIIISIAVLSSIIQYFIIKDKFTATLVIDKTSLIINDLFIKTYDLTTLNKIRFDGFNETYTAEFSNSKSIRIKKADYRQDELDKFLAVMTAKSNCNVVLPDNIRAAITAVTPLS